MSSVAVMDGGFATWLEAHGHDLSQGHLWSAKLLGDRAGHAAIRDAHESFLLAGACACTTASYQASRAGLMAAGLASTEGDADRLMHRSVRLAREASSIASAGHATVVGSVGPFGACLADGSEYSGSYRLQTTRPSLPGEASAPAAGVAPDGEAPDDTAGLPQELLRGPAWRSAAADGSLNAVPWLSSFQQPRMAALALGGCDLLLAETVPCVADAVAVIAAARRMSPDCPPLAISFTVQPCGERLASGEPLALAVALSLAADRGAGVLSGLGVNCCHPAAVSPSLKMISACLAADEAAAGLPGRPGLPLEVAGDLTARAAAADAPQPAAGDATGAVCRHASWAVAPLAAASSADASAVAGSCDAATAGATWPALPAAAPAAAPDAAAPDAAASKATAAGSSPLRRWLRQRAAGGALPRFLWCCPNAGEAWDADGAGWVHVPASAPLATPAARELGALVVDWAGIAEGRVLCVGGCCRVGEDTIARMASTAARLATATGRCNEPG